MSLRAGAGTDCGRVRKLNEDIYVSRAGQGLFLICDGMGGAPAGEVASQIAMDAILAQLDASPPLDTASIDERGYRPQTRRLAEAVRRSNRIVYDHAQSDPSCARMGTTVVGVWITQHIASVAHVGDSRAYLWHEDQLDPLTRDHSLVEAHLEAGLLSPDEAVHSKQQNILVRVLGREPDVDVDLREVPVQPGDYLLLCSDGLTRMVPDGLLGQAIVRLRHPQRICDYLIETANAGGGTDNITVVVVEVTNRFWPRLALFGR
jgi:serine/threonine protein phosphatase PrpC